MEKTISFLIFICSLILAGCGTTKDQEVNNFKTVKIDDQIWMSENLDVDRYRNGDPIPQVQDKEEWAILETGAWCYSDNDPSNGIKYGKLYNWYAVIDPRGLAPEGWHIPTKEEFETLKATAHNDGKTLKLIGQGTGTNTTGFSALLAGSRVYDGDFYGLGYNAYFWSSTGDEKPTACYLGLFDDVSGVKLVYYFKEVGFSVRCLKDYGTKDQEVNNFKTVKIDDQIWMSENLDVDRYRNGDPIPQVQNKDEWVNLKTGAWCYYDNDPTNGRKYGKLYNWYAVNDSKELAPEGWHIPTEEEFEILREAVNDDGITLKAVGQGSGSEAGTNSSGFSALLAGGRYSDGNFLNLGYYTALWSSTEYDATFAYFLYLGGNGSNIILSYYFKEYGFSVRCLKD